MRCVTCLSLGLLAATLLNVQAAPAPKPKNATPAVLDAGREDHIAGVMEDIVDWARVGVRENKKVADLDLIRRQKDWESWLKKNLRFEKIKDSSRFRLGFREGSPQEQAAIINVVVDCYLKKVVGKTRESLTRSVKDVKNLRDGLKANHRLTAKVAEGMERKIKILEERIRRLPALVEHAKAR